MPLLLRTSPKLPRSVPSHGSGFPDNRKCFVDVAAQADADPAPSPQARPREEDGARPCNAEVKDGPWRARPLRDPTLPEAEIATGVSRVAVTATAMPKGPKQQPPEPEWIGDGESTSPTGEADREPTRGKKGRRECACFRNGSRGVRGIGP